MKFPSRHIGTFRNDNELSVIGFADLRFHVTYKKQIINSLLVDKARNEELA